MNLLTTDIASGQGLKLSLKVMNFIRDIISEIGEETGDLFNLEATPAEGTSFRLALLDKKQFPSILCANEDEYRKGPALFYTSSTQLAVNHTDDIFETLKHQDQLQEKYTGGTVLHIYLGEQVSDIETIKGLIKKTP